MKPVRRRVLWPKLIVNGRRWPHPMKQMIHPTFLPFNFLLKLCSIPFNTFIPNWFSNNFFFFLW
ncbi:hypothetical protein Hanom_Chr17g01566651 [Helianthus anomalus]